MSSLLNKSVASIRNVVDPYKLDIQQMNHQKCKPTLEVQKRVLLLEKETLNLLHPNTLFLHCLKTSENLSFSDVFRRYSNGKLG